MINKLHIKHLKTIGILLLIIILFSASLYTFFYGEISNASTFVDYMYFGMATTTTLGAGDMVPMTQGLRIYITMYIFVFLYILVFSDLILID
jgi:voltage-gated potassium channel